MAMKKITLSMMAVVCVYGVSITMTIEIEPSHEIIDLSQEVANYNEPVVIATGAASHGIHSVTGRACVVMKRKQLKRVRKGDIVVAPEINSLWYGGLSSAAGIIIEKGDANSHALALGKKLGIPVIVGAAGITKNIIDGQTITCDPVAKAVYHVSYPDDKKIQLDVIDVSQKNRGHQCIHDKLVGIQVSDEQMEKDTMLDIETKGFSVVLDSHRHRGIIQDASVDMAKHVTKDIYNAHFNRFKKFALKTQADYKWAKSWGILEKGARLTGRDSFTIDCMAIGDVLLGSSEKYLVEVLGRISEEKYIRYMDILIDRCMKRPKNIKEVNWAARVSHEEHVKNIDIPAEIDKEKLIEHPKEYKKVEDMVDREELENLVAAGLFPLYCMENNIPL